MLKTDGEDGRSEEVAIELASMPCSFLHFTKVRGLPRVGVLPKAAMEAKWGLYL